MAVATDARVALLDVNVLVAMFDDSHVHHTVAHDWFSSRPTGSWATCPITENGFIRTVSRVLPLGDRPSVGNAIHVLRRFRQSGGHQFWNDDLSLTDSAWFAQGRLGHQQLTDVYLLALAVKRSGTLVTFDRGIPLTAVRNAASKHLAVLAPGD